MTRIELTPVSADDCRDLWMWRNHPEVRKNFFDEKPVSWRRHKKWFYSRIKDSNTKIYIAKKNKERIGVVRFEIERHFIKVSVNLNPDFFGRGLGAELIRLGTKKVFSETRTTKPILAEIKKDNVVSQRAFSKAGYSHAKETKERLVYKRER